MISSRISIIIHLVYNNYTYHGYITNIYLGAKAKSIYSTNGIMNGMNRRAREEIQNKNELISNTKPKNWRTNKSLPHLERSKIPQIPRQNPHHVENCTQTSNGIHHLDIYWAE